MYIYIYISDNDIKNCSICGHFDIHWTSRLGLLVARKSSAVEIFTMGIRYIYFNNQLNNLTIPQNVGISLDVK